MVTRFELYNSCLKIAVKKLVQLQNANIISKELLIEFFVLMFLIDELIDQCILVQEYSV